MRHPIGGGKGQNVGTCVYLKYLHNFSSVRQHCCSMSYLFALSFLPSCPFYSHTHPSPAAAACQLIVCNDFIGLYNILSEFHSHFSLFFFITPVATAREGGKRGGGTNMIRFRMNHRNFIAPHTHTRTHNHNLFALAVK